MAFKTVSGAFTYVKYKECEAGQILAEGTYLGTQQGRYGIQHQIRKDDGGIVVLNSSGQLNYALENHVSKADYIRVTYTGTIILSKGNFEGKESHQFLVEVDSDRKSDSNVNTVTDSEEEDETPKVAALPKGKQNADEVLNKYRHRV